MRVNGDFLAMAKLDCTNKKKCENKTNYIFFKGSTIVINTLCCYFWNYKVP